LADDDLITRAEPRNQKRGTHDNQTENTQSTGGGGRTEAEKLMFKFSA
jgi:hypothetical protein